MSGTHTSDTEEHGLHPTEAFYVKVAGILAVVTLIEVGLYYTDFGEAATNVTLLVLAGAKFIMVAAYFMHLRFDNRVLRRLFIAGFILAIACYVGYLMTLGIFV